MAEFANKNEQNNEEIFSKAVRAGKRTYFFDVRSTRSNDYYLTITESKKRMNDGSDKPFYEKHKLFLYKEDFDKFVDGLSEAIKHIRENQPDSVNPEVQAESSDSANTESGSRFSDVEFDDLGKDKD